MTARIFFKKTLFLILAISIILAGILVWLHLCWYHMQFLYELPDSVWYCEETNMQATVIDSSYMAIVDLDDGQEYTVEFFDRDNIRFHKGVVDFETESLDSYCECGTKMNVKRSFMKIKSFILNTADNCPHLPCDGSITFVREK